MKVLSLYNIKGGVGKTASAVNLAYLAAEAGARTLLWDLDPQGATSFYLRVRAEVDGGSKRLLRKKKRLHKQIRGTDWIGLDLIPADFTYRDMDLELDDVKKPKKRLAALIAPLREEYDLLFLDCPPSISLASESVFVAADALLVPTIPTHLSLRTLEQLHGHLSREGPRRLEVLPFFCLVDRRKSLHRDTLSLAQSAPYRFLDTEIPYATEVERMGIARAPLLTFDRSCRAARAYLALWHEICQRLELSS